MKTLAERLALSPATISLVLNDAPAASGIPSATRQRIIKEARRLNYRPNFMARSLRKQRSFTVGVLVPEVSEGYAALVMSGIEDLLLQEGYFYFVASHRHRNDLLEEYPKLLIDRAVEGLIAVDTECRTDLPVPVVSVSGSGHRNGASSITLDHTRAAELALAHLASLGHRRIAFMKGQAFSSDTQVRWTAILAAARRLGLPVKPKLTIQLEGDLPSPELGYESTHELLATGLPFTALFAFNDISAIGAVRAIREAGLRVPEDVSVVGFDDIQSAAFQNPALTTVRQPLRRMGELAARVLLKRIAEAEQKNMLPIVVEPELIMRESTAEARPLTAN